MLVRQLALIGVRAEAALGALDAEARPSGRPSTEEKSLPTRDFPALNVAPTTRSNWRKLGALDDEKLDQVEPLPGTQSPATFLQHGTAVTILSVLRLL